MLNNTTLDLFESLAESNCVLIKKGLYTPDFACIREKSIEIVRDDIFLDAILILVLVTFKPVLARMCRAISAKLRGEGHVWIAGEFEGLADGKLGEVIDFAVGLFCLLIIYYHSIAGRWIF